MNWKEKAACKNKGVNLFFNRRTKENINLAESLCKICPVREQCLEFALTKEKNESIRAGIWGGKLPKERAKIQYERDTNKRYIN